MKCLLIRLNTTNRLKNVVNTHTGYKDCIGGFSYFIGEWEEAIKFFGKENIQSIEYVGEGYYNEN